MTVTLKTPRGILAFAMCILAGVAVGLGLVVGWPWSMLPLGGAGLFVMALAVNRDPLKTTQAERDRCREAWYTQGNVGHGLHGTGYVMTRKFVLALLDDVDGIDKPGNPARR